MRLFSRKKEPTTTPPSGPHANVFSTEDKYICDKCNQMFGFYSIVRIVVDEPYQLMKRNMFVCVNCYRVTPLG
jgi:hypothetical protein